MWLVVVGGAIGAAIAVYGLVIVASRGRRGSRRSGMYALCFGAALVLLATSSLLNARDLGPPAILALAAALTLAGLAVFRYRPRAGAR